MGCTQYSIKGIFSQLLPDAKSEAKIDTNRESKYLLKRMREAANRYILTQFEVCSKESRLHLVEVF